MTDLFRWIQVLVKSAQVDDDINTQRAKKSKMIALWLF